VERDTTLLFKPQRAAARAKRSGVRESITGKPANNASSDAEQP